MAEKKDVIVETTEGKIKGYQEDGIHYFKGIPFAAPPVGDLRWLPPQPVEPWTGVRSADSFGCYSYQKKDEAELMASLLGLKPGLKDQSEDCLYLNVFSPGLDNSKRPVMVWIHGGAFRIGAGSDLVYDCSKLVKRGDTVIVTINYRLGPFGFLNLNEITKGQLPSTGSEGLLDQVAALQWVKENIENFGGDPNNVTIFGESAGGISVACLLAMPAARGLFHRAISQSGSAEAQPVEKAFLVSKHFLDILGIKPEEADIMQTFSPERLMSAMDELVKRGLKSIPEIGRFPFWPTVDGTVLPKSPKEAVKNGSAKGIPILMGTNLDEMKLLGAMFPKLAQADEDRLIEYFRPMISDEEAKKIITAYREGRNRRNEPAGPVDIIMAIETDRAFRMPTLNLAEAHSKQGSPVYVYLFTWPSPLFDGKLGACHALEIGFVFGNYEGPFCGSGPAADRLSREMQDAWLTFARTGNPSCESLGKWPVYGGDKESMILGKESGVQKAPYDEERQAWDSVPNAFLGLLR